MNAQCHNVIKFFKNKIYNNSLLTSRLHQKQKKNLSHYFFFYFFFSTPYLTKFIVNCTKSINHLIESTHAHTSNFKYICFGSSERNENKMHETFNSITIIDSITYMCMKKQKKNNENEIDEVSSACV